ncbi:MAG: peptide chain release factor N(5)-glutamine methyltransferase [Treponema sp.]|jgi:release factor glutamine methyltransferase|nr:peptide chain release factor N(5)-glutamine methyltransferase [Treponema sp.]
MNIRNALSSAVAELKSAGIESSPLDASLLLADVLNTTRTTLYARGTDTLSDGALSAFCALIQRRLNGECTAYLLGKKEFRNLEFLVNKSVLVPRPETETLVETAVEIISKEETAGSVRILDLCTGSGAIAVSIKNEMPKTEVWASDICDQALETAKTNANCLLPANSIQFLKSDLYSELHAMQFSVIVSNPPYIPTGEIGTLPAEVQNEPRLALDGGHTGLEIIKRIIEDAPKYLQENGTLLMEADPRQMKDIAILLERKGFAGVKSYKDLSGRERVIGGAYQERI